MDVFDATEGDLPAILDIYNEAVANTTAIWNKTLADLENRRDWMQSRQAQGYPVLVTRDPSGLATGYASFGDWRGWEGYRFTVEHSIYVHKDHRGQGVAKRLLDELILRARAQGKHAMVAGIDGTNAASIRLHMRHGFEEVGRMREVGAKFGTWLDLVMMQLILDERSTPDSAT